MSSLKEVPFYGLKYSIKAFEESKMVMTYSLIVILPNFTNLCSTNWCIRKRWRMYFNKKVIFYLILVELLSKITKFFHIRKGASFYYLSRSEWRHYLLGNKVTIETSQKSLNVPGDSNPGVWSLGYDFEIFFKAQYVILSLPSFEFLKQLRIENVSSIELRC